MINYIEEDRPNREKECKAYFEAFERQHPGKNPYFYSTSHCEEDGNHVIVRKVNSQICCSIYYDLYNLGKAFAFYKRCYPLFSRRKAVTKKVEN